VGTATHRLLAHADYARHVTELEVGALRKALVQRGLLATPPAQQIDCAAVARAVRELAPLVLRPGAQLMRELPVALLIPAADAAQALGRAPQALGTGDTVYVQGVLDLLQVTEAAALVLDFKTDRADAAQLLARYTLQLQWYARAVRELLPACRVSWALYGLRGAGLVGPFEY
jgi:ATP-dependent exoDNAse (exonuclease V) beta subunit